MGVKLLAHTTQRTKDVPVEPEDWMREKETEITKQKQATAPRPWHAPVSIYVLDCLARADGVFLP
jgi:hypothetical protein